MRGAAAASAFDGRARGDADVRIVDRFDAFFLDLDGVVYVGDEALPGAVEMIAKLRADGKRVLFLTNDPRGPRPEYAAKLEGLGIPATADDVLTSGAATAVYLSRHEEVGGRTAYVIGTDALKDEMRAVGLRVLEGEPGLDADFVIVGGHRGFDYAELRIASLAVHRGARLYACNRDATFPMPDGPWPAVGAILAAVETAAGSRAIAVGKPEPAMFEAARTIIGPVDRIAMVGDNPASDVEGGRRAGLATILVDPFGALPAEPRPDFVVADLTGLFEGDGKAGR
jgi:HAD superfamily hydrolase (TIGR01450 family)